MPWNYRDIRTFPARYPAAMREAVENLNEPIIFDNFANPIAARTVAEMLRWFRWCLRERPGVDRQLSLYEEMYQFRTSTEETAGRVFLYLTAKPTIRSALRDLNPHLTGLIDDA